MAILGAFAVGVAVGIAVVLGVAAVVGPARVEAQDKVMDQLRALNRQLATEAERVQALQSLVNDLQAHIADAIQLLQAASDQGLTDPDRG